MQLNLHAICEQVMAIAKEAGHFIQQEGLRFDRKSIEYKGVSDLVSYVDKQAERMIVEGLTPLIEGAGFIAEEGTGSRNPEGYNWVIDPLDGTTNFMHNVPWYCVSIGLEWQGEVLLGVIYHPALQECFHAVRGGGAFCNGVPIHASSAVGLKDALIVTGFPYRSLSKFQPFIDSILAIVENSHGFRRIGSAALDLAYVAAGRFEAFFEYGLKPWDISAGILLVEEAGGKVTDFSNKGQVLFGKEMLAAAPNVHSELFQIVSRNFIG